MPNSRYNVQLDRMEDGAIVQCTQEELDQLLAEGFVVIQPVVPAKLPGYDKRSSVSARNDPKRAILNFLSQRPWEQPRDSGVSVSESGRGGVER